MTSQVVPEGVDLDARNEEGLTALFVACYAQNFAVVQTLISRGANVNATCQDGWTPLMAACMRGNLTIAKALLEAGADVKAENNETGCCALMFATQVGNLELVRELAPRASINRQSKDGWTVVMLATQNNCLDVVSYLVKDCGADVNLSDARGYTPLHYASQEGLLEMTDLLLRFGANPALADTNGVTPLHWAVYLKSLPLVEMLVEAGANVDAKNAAGATPMKIAKLSGQEDIVNFLLSKNALDQDDE